MNVELINYTEDALEKLLLTKQTRLTMEPGLLDQIRSWSDERKMKELEYMLGTIQSSWEFVDYTFMIDGVSRAFTHQLVRTREGSYAQQSQRTVEMDGFEYVATGVLQDHNTIGAEYYDQTMRLIQLRYDGLLEMGVPPQDARGVLPTNICTNIVAKFNLRTLSNMAKLRLCTRTQGEYQDVFRLIRQRVIEVHPWTEPFLRVHCAALGVCQFPNYKECPIKSSTFNPDTGLRWDGNSTRPDTKEEIQTNWLNTKFEAIPNQGKRT